MHARHHYFTLAVKTYWATPTKLIRAHCEFFLLYSKKFTLHHLYKWALRYHFGLIIFLITPFKFFDSFLILSNRCLCCLIYYFLVETSPCFCLCILRLHAISNNYIYIVDMADKICQGITLYSHVNVSELNRKKIYNAINRQRSSGHLWTCNQNVLSFFRLNRPEAY